MWFRSTNKKVNSASKTTDLSLWFGSAVRSLKDFYLTNCTSFLMKMTSLSIILKSCLSQMKFPMEWKKANVVSIHKKNDKQCIKNYRPVSLLLICSKIFGRLLFNELYKFFNENDLLSSKQSGFRPGDSCIN